QSLKSILASSSLQLSPQLFLNAQNIQLKQAEQSKPKETVSCHYKIPEEIIKTDINIILQWAEYAAMQSFHFDYTALEAELKELKSCYTEKGWSEFNAAMHKSGNLNAITAQRLTMNSLIDGQARLIESQDNQWKIQLPLKVIYKNDRTQVSQFLDIQLTVGRKMNGELGIVQLIAVLK
ncbi:TPA: DotI/IcmL family type IV secretion protein, partial [Legionella pneumophila]|nr:DotI/IcmL family type IV secretion protein [Legionella pneumophila]